MSSWFVPKTGSDPTADTDKRAGSVQSRQRPPEPETDKSKRDWDKGSGRGSENQGKDNKIKQSQNNNTHLNRQTVFDNRLATKTLAFHDFLDNVTVGSFRPQVHEIPNVNMYCEKIH